MFSKRRGIAPAIAVLLLMAITIAGGSFLYSAMQDQQEISEKSTTVDVIVIALEDSLVTDKALFTVTLKNSGSNYLSDIEVGFYDDTSTLIGFSETSLTISPGDQWAKTELLDAQIVEENQYSVRIQVTDAAGSEYSEALQVTAG